MELKKWLNANETVVVIVGGAVATLISVTAYAFTTFQTKDEFKTIFEIVDRRLERIELKIDDLKQKE